MNWQQLISNKRLGQELKHSERHDDRSEFRRDYDRLIFSAPFRRMQNKTQVFPLPGSIFVHNRLTHSLEVSSVGRSLGDDVMAKLVERHPELRGTLFEEIGTIVSAACLAHDMGNPPFGHSGEKAIQSYFTEGPGAYLQDRVSPVFWEDITHFEGNANAFRLLTHRYRGRRDGGFVMTYSTLASIVKYPIPSTKAGKKGKFGFFESERATYERIAAELGLSESPPQSPLGGKKDPCNESTQCLKSAQSFLEEKKETGSESTPPPKGGLRGAPPYLRHPLVYLVEAADDICYEIMDIEDAHKLKLLSYEETESLLLQFFDEQTQEQIRRRVVDEGVLDENERVVYMRACVIGKLENECVRVFCDNEEAILAGTLQGSLIDNINPLQRDAYRRCMGVSLKKIYHSRVVLDVELSGYKIMETLMRDLIEAAVSPGKFHSQQLIRRVSSQYDIGSDDLETRIMAIIDYISGMTDIYALDIYQKINGISLPVI